MTVVVQERHERFMRRNFIEQEIQDLEKQIRPHDTGHIHTTINTLKHQYKQLTGFEYGTHPNMTTVETPDPESPFVQYGKDEHEVYLDPEAVKKLTPNWHGDDEDFQEEELPFEFVSDWKYNEEELIQEFKEYVEATYDEHYSQNKYQATEIAIEAGHGTGFCIGNILKYAQRYGRKGTAANARKDLLQIMHYALIQLYIHDTES